MDMFPIILLGRHKTRQISIMWLRSEGLKCFEGSYRFDRHIVCMHLRNSGPASWLCGLGCLPRQWLFRLQVWKCVWHYSKGFRPAFDRAWHIAEMKWSLEHRKLLGFRNKAPLSGALCGQTSLLLLPMKTKEPFPKGSFCPSNRDVKEVQVQMTVSPQVRQ